MCLSELAESSVLWIGAEPEQDRFQSIAPRRVVTMLGRSFDAVVLDAHDGLDADVLGQSHGLVRGGGALVLRLPPLGVGPSALIQTKLAAFPHEPSDVGTRFFTHVERALARSECVETESPAALVAPSHVVTGHEEQAQLVEHLRRRWSSSGPTRTAVLADRGRGKSSALGLALRHTLSHTTMRIAVSSAHPEAVAEVFRFACDDPAILLEGRLRFVPMSELVFGEVDRFDLIVVDEAAQLPVPMLRRLVEIHEEAHLVLCTTTHGYEGTGRGFSLRLLSWIERGPIPLERLSLTNPIRWGEGDPLERLVFDALLLDAEPTTSVQVEDDRLEAVRLDRDALWADETQLREFFGLLVHAHYRTTPSDLHRLLDAPNLELHALRHDGHVVAATILAREGDLPEALIDDVLHGRTRLRAHALPDALVAHLGKRDAGGLSMVRSVRIATHPELRRRGLATQLVELVHRESTPDLFGTLFGATPALIGFRRSVGYEVVRLSASRGARTGEPSVMMIRARSERARALCRELRAELARDLPRQLELLRSDGETLLDPALLEALGRDLPPPAPLSSARCHELARAYAFGPRTFESVALPLARFIEEEPQRLARLSSSARELVSGRVLEGQGWRQVTARANYQSVTVAMRALRRAIRDLVQDTDPSDLS